jgi:hypothetical protein
MEDKLSKRCFTFSVFTQPRPKADLDRQLALARTRAKPLTSTFKRDLAQLRQQIAALQPAAAAAREDPIAWAARASGLVLDDWQKQVIGTAAPRLSADERPVRNIGRNISIVSPEITKNNRL